MSISDYDWDHLPASVRDQLDPDGVEGALTIINADDDPDCATCIAAEPGTPSHRGSTGCTSGSRSIAAGGGRSHCSCDFCY